MSPPGRPKGEYRSAQHAGSPVRRAATAVSQRTTAAPALRVLLGLVALLCAVLGAWLAAHHPLGGAAALLLFGALTALAWAWPGGWLVWLPALVPCLGLAAWSGWITVEETDLLVLAAAAGAYARWAGRPVRPTGRPLLGLGLGWLWIALWTVSVALATWRGVVDAGGLQLDWYGAYRSPMNALRLSKPTLALLLLLPLWLHAANRAALQPAATPAASPALPPGQPPLAATGLPAGAASAADQLTLGLALGHGAAALGCLWERVAYPGLLNFSSDYRTTGLFWEMHVGGAALDGFLALTMPFAVRLLWTARRRSVWLLGCVITLLGAYAAVTTFSRIVFLAVPLAVALMVLLQQLQAASGPTRLPGAAPSPGVDRLGTAALLLLGGVAAAAAVFPTAGYRGMLALLGAIGVLLVLGPQLPALRARWKLLALALAVLLGPLLLLGAAAVPKGPYLLCGALLLLGLAAALLAPRGGQPVALLLVVAAASLLVALASTVQVAWFWAAAPDTALWHAVPPVAAVALAALLCAAWPVAPWPGSLRWQAGLLAAMVVGAAVVAVFAGGAYMSNRVAEVDSDERGRLQHWHEALQRRPNGPARWWGVGLGRFLDHYAIGAAPADRPGDMRLVLADGQPAMRIATSKQDMSWGRLLRLSQRIQRPAGQLTARITLRTPDRPQLHVDVCIKHLLYDDGCQAAQMQVLSKGVAPGAWQTVSLPLSAKPLPLDAWYAPRFTMFSLSAEGAVQPIEVREVSLRDASGHELLDNRSFELGGARWFFSSDRNHMPWHAKNMAVHLLFEQGYFGLAALGLLSVAALTRLTLGRARRHPLAPALAGALLGFWVVGAVDSLLDMPRVATLFLLLTAVGLSLRDSRQR